MSGVRSFGGVADTVIKRVRRMPKKIDEITLGLYTDDVEPWTELRISYSGGEGYIEFRQGTRILSFIIDDSDIIDDIITDLGRLKECMEEE